MTDVEAGLAAADAGLTLGDIIQELDGQPVESALDLESKLGPGHPASRSAWASGGARARRSR